MERVIIDFELIVIIVCICERRGGGGGGGGGHLTSIKVRKVELTH